MDNTTLLTIIGGIIVLILVIIAIIIGLKTNKTNNGKLEAENFLTGLSDVFYNKMVEIINEFDFSQYSSIAEAETAVLKQIYEAVWDYTRRQLDIISNKNILTKLAIKIIDEDFVIKFIDNLASNKNISELIENSYSNIVKGRLDSMVEEDEKLQEEFSDQSKYVEDFDSVDLEPAKEEDDNSDDGEPINPPRDEEEPYNESDESMEIVDEDDDIYIDKGGRKRSRKTGKWV
jgi:Asp-tRNA(Asn)/Glu-tRNA(Gln) amidotransferase C subunit